MAEISDYGRLVASGELADIVQMCATNGIKIGSSIVRYYRYVEWADGRKWTKRVPDPVPEIGDYVRIRKAIRPLEAARFRR